MKNKNVKIDPFRCKNCENNNNNISIFVKLAIAEIEEVFKRGTEEIDDLIFAKF
jgi:hypothetical protein